MLRDGGVDGDLLATHVRRLRASGIEVLPSIPGASVLLAARPGDADDEDDTDEDDYIDG